MNATHAFASSAVNRYRVLLASTLLFGATVSGAQQVYKSVDADGVVTYSSSPPRDAPQDRIEKVRVDPAPPEADRTAAERRISSAQQQSPRPAPDSSQTNRRESAQKADKSGKASPSEWDAWSAGVIERSRSNGRVARPAGGVGSANGGRAQGQPASERTSR